MSAEHGLRVLLHKTDPWSCRCEECVAATDADAPHWELQDEEARERRAETRADLERWGQ